MPATELGTANIDSKGVPALSLQGNFEKRGEGGGGETICGDRM